MNKPRHFVLTASLALLAGVASSCPTSSGAAQPQPSPAKAAPLALPSPSDPKPRDYPGIHNAVAYHTGFVSGGAPEGDSGFDTLAAMGIRTIITVDGAVPEVDKAKVRGIRYIHLPVGYNGFDEQRKLQLVRATRDAMMDGPVYIHCHHGKHRSAGAAAAIAVSLGWETPGEAVDRMKVSGTAPNYKGLYACATNATQLSADAINAVPADFPAVSKPTGFVQGMVEIDEVYDHLKQIEKADWKAPADHPDLVPAAEAGRLADLFRALAEGGRAKGKPADFAEQLRENDRRAQSVEDLLAAGEMDAAKLSAALKLVGASCKDCHAKYRD